MDGCIITLPPHHLSRLGTVTTASLFLEGQELECQAGKLNNFSPLGHSSFFRELQATEGWCKAVELLKHRAFLPPWNVTVKALFWPCLVLENWFGKMTWKLCRQWGLSSSLKQWATMLWPLSARCCLLKGNYVDPRATVINRAETLIWSIIITIMLTTDIFTGIALRQALS